MAMAVLEWLLVVGVAGLLSLALLSVVRKIQQERRLREAFYYLIEAHEGRISLIQLAATARADAEPAKIYLEAQAKVFLAMPEVDMEGNTFYQFPKVQRSLSTAQDDW